jgi:DNA-binding NtrC family response regulator
VVAATSMRARVWTHIMYSYLPGRCRCADVPYCPTAFSRSGGAIDDAANEALQIRDPRDESARAFGQGAQAACVERGESAQDPAPAGLASRAWRLPIRTRALAAELAGGTPGRLDMAGSEHPVLLVADDEDGVVHIVERLASRAGFDVICCRGGRQAIEELRVRQVDVAMIDLRMPDLDGLEVLRQIKAANPACEVVLMTGFAEVDTAVEAIKLGARDYLSKPFDFSRLSTLLASVRQDAVRRRSLIAIESQIARQLDLEGMVGRSPVMQEIFSLIRRLAPHVRVALVTGETGTGKELVARALHRSGPRRSRRFVAVNCSAIVESLFESELFGHVRGAFTGAIEAKPGLIEAADGGTLFLDEVGELPGTLQGKLLRAIETGEVQRVGSLEPRRVDLCIIAATNRDLRSDVTAGRFRSDLFYRLNAVELRLPALRERREDIPYLTAVFVRDCSQRMGKAVQGLTTGAEQRLMSAPWDGNVRELRNAIERACMLADGRLITERELGALQQEAGAVAVVPERADRPVARQAEEDEAAGTGEGAASLDRLEREHILRVLERARGNKKAAAELLGVSRRALYRRIERHGLEVVERRQRALS